MGRLLAAIDSEHSRSEQARLKERSRALTVSAAAADDVAGGHTYSPADGVDFADLNISADLGDWEKKVFASVNHLRKG